MGSGPDPGERTGPEPLAGDANPGPAGAGRATAFFHRTGPSRTACERAGCELPARDVDGWPAATGQATAFFHTTGLSRTVRDGGRSPAGRGVPPSKRSGRLESGGLSAGPGERAGRTPWLAGGGKRVWGIWVALGRGGLSPVPAAPPWGRRPSSSVLSPEARAEGRREKGIPAPEHGLQSLTGSPGGCGGHGSWSSASPAGAGESWLEKPGERTWENTL
jgi:hypothetical protein